MADDPIIAFEAAARDYLAAQLGDRAPRSLHHAGTFAERPLEGEGTVALFSFDAEVMTARDVREPVRHYVAVGETSPNYFPAYGLDPDGAYSFHVGTRFMLGMGIQLVDPSLEPPGARDRLRAVLDEHAPRADLQIDELAALFRCEDDYYGVYRLRIDGEPLYFMGADCPPGFYRMTEHPPQAALRLHLGQLIRAEARGSSSEIGATATSSVIGAAATELED